MEQNQNNNSSNSNNKGLMWAGIAIVVVIALAIAIPHFKKSSDSAVSTDTTTTVPSDTTSSATGSAAAGTAASAGGATWNAVMKQYNGRTVVFGDNCVATPNDQVQALGTKVLLVNNGNTAHTIIFGNDSGVTIAAHHYKTAIVDTSATVVMSCDSNQHAATITVK